MEFTENTRLADIVAAYPWLPGEAAKIDARLKIIDTPVGRMLIRRSTLADAARLSGYPADTIIEELKRLIAEHEKTAR